SGFHSQPTRQFLYSSRLRTRLKTNTVGLYQSPHTTLTHIKKIKLLYISIPPIKTEEMESQRGPQTMALLEPSSLN
ncbi:hypothetical protein, partial [Acetobacter indonesiensis]|uniref:hypothetical protein n=1 Tax=Acetobacter indonesiensis TaxID=104101 RepID=UPI001C4ECBB7